MSLVITALASGIACVVGPLLHEATHYLVARLFGYEATYDPIHLEVAYAEPSDTGRLVINAAPVTVGILTAIAWLVAGLPMPFYLVVGWGAYTLLGSLEDYKPIMETMGFRGDKVQIAALQALVVYGIVNTLHMLWSYELISFKPYLVASTFFGVVAIWATAKIAFLADDRREERCEATSNA